MTRSVPEWIGKTDDSMPSVNVRLRIYSKQNGICACGCERVMNMNRDRIDCDHTIPLADGGENCEGNLQLLLHEHHKPKTATENSQRAEAKRFKARAFGKPKSNRPLQGRGFGYQPGNAKYVNQDLIDEGIMK